MTTKPPAGPTSDDDGAKAQAEIERLRAEVARLEEERTVPLPVDEREAPKRGGWWRGVVMVVCLVLLAIITPLAVVATWAHDQVGDTDRWVATVAPLADDPAVQNAVADRITNEIVTRIDVKAITSEAVDALAERGLPTNVATNLKALGTPLAQGVQSFVHERVLQLVQSDAFAEAWATANREAHEQMVAVLTGETGNAVEVKGSSVQLNLAVLIDTVKTKLVDSGFELAGRIPNVTATFTLVQSADLAKAQNGFRLLNAVARALPILALLLLGGAILAAKRRRRALMIGSLVVAGSMLVLGVTLNGFRIVYLNAVPTDTLPPDAAGAIYDQVVWFIRLNIRALLVLFLAIAAVAWVSGPDPAPVAVRRGATRVLDSVRNRSDRAGLNTGPVGDFLGRYRTAIRIAVAAIVVVVYVSADHPTGAFTFKLLLAAAAVLLIAELLARTPTESDSDVTDPAPAPDPPRP
ncbi:MAG TPA: hypothetical protein PLZ93_03080 [Nocardioides sp.]|uniref:hypothetical protein n=1 Tax=uncultured Nocardioides sp. TaxID=198441 RepID=UPI000ED13842|nr:hypothetical protein [uncultured Nocardioides sp.]HCB02896.1 hypothetical protein [Nocardioides sp.]HRD59994.1 hypothetical protein [Nocardioides sp.]HRI94574.1 hypothetical protein [Nocardioides sp.]HRK44449.1 hypothetical protein [Nocardioides sp.]